MRIGYLLPRFPTQTSVFYWREAKALGCIGISVDIVSIRRACCPVHSWAAEAMDRTTYLFPMSPKSLVGSLREILRAGPRALLRCLGTVSCAREFSTLGKIRLAALILMGAQLCHLARHRDWSHVHVHKSGNLANIAMFAHFLSGISYSVTLHNGLEYDGPILKEKWRHALFATVVSRFLLMEVRQRLADCLPRTVAVAPMGVDMAFFSRQQPFSPWNGRGPCLIFSCARLDPLKGHDDLIKAIALLRNHGLDVRLGIAGEDELPGGYVRSEIERLIDALNLTGIVALLGAVTEDRVRSELEAAHVFVLASRREAIGVATMEAMAMGVPVVVTHVGGVPELVSDGVEGLLVEPGAPDQIAEALLKLLLNPGLARQMGDAGRRKVAAFFNAGVSAAIMKSTMEQERLIACDHTDARRT